jgi:hypothetical protein
VTGPPAAALERLERAIAPLEPLNDPAVGVGRDFSAPSQTMLLMFAGMAPWPAIPGWVLFAHTTGLPVKRMFVRDVHSVWYQRGVPVFGDTIEAVAGSLRTVIEQAGVERLVVSGPSAGGYAALVFGALLGADVVLSFSPQTTLAPRDLHALGDHRWDDALARLDRLGGSDGRYADLREALPPIRRAHTRCEVHFGSSFELDAAHARRLEGMPGIELHSHDHEGHLLLRALRDSGELLEILRGALAV